MSDKAFWSRVKSAVVLKEKIKVLQSQLDDVNTEIKQYMTDNEESVAENSKYSVHYTPYTRSSFDSARFKEEYPRMFKQFSKASNATRLTINTL